MKEHTKKYIHNNQKNFQRGNKTKKETNNYLFYISTNKQAAEYKIASEFIINFIKRIFDRGNDIAGTLQTLTIQDTSMWMPKFKMGKSEDKDTKKTENRQNELEYNALLDETIEIKEIYSHNLYKAYAFLRGKYSHFMQNKIT